ncbi:hypothetical protein LOTGIDRAFT_234666 [Lottia gigantea]|uniref:Protein FAM184A/B N-terminal domain-containing protein n=1 Tax=Lottia gigantea TaxID=225164 RepID=V3ZBJ0_LOTGI|nr:hypothetical protein LOTGIDRAFT_234666 [Lottia gigantea]ESO88373.1 hypothetical protein LOTGIDRAFT_234666 [Lottia gigantea]
MDKPKKTFEFRMSKKVAELTQVVHMLFTRNHEKEIEMEALKDAYEHEIELVIKDAKNKISLLEKQISELLKNRQKNSEKQLDLKAMRDEYERKVKDLESSLHDEKTECQNLRDLLINAQGDIEKLRCGVSDQIVHKNEELKRKEVEMDKLRKRSAILEKNLKETEREMTLTMREAENNAAKLREEITHIHSALDDSYQTRESLHSRIKQLEADLKSYKRDFSRKVTETVANQVGRLSKSVHYSESEELEKLRKEIQKYRLELSNRDCNFNRMFTEKQPIFIDQRSNGAKTNGHHPNSATSSHTNGVTSASPSPQLSSAFYRRERSFSQIISLPSEDQKSAIQRPCSAADLGQLPKIAATYSDRAKISKLVKPKPLPREMLFSK